MKTVVEIIQKKLRKRHDAFWYDGLIAVCGRYKLMVCGEIKVSYRGSSGWTCDYNAVGEAFRRKLTDKTLYNGVSGIEDTDMNNWFEIVGKSGESALGDVVYTYDEGIELLKTYFREDMLGEYEDL